MPVIRNARTHWTGSLEDGGGKTAFVSSGLPDVDVTWASRANDPDGKTSPEELIAAAHATCYSMALSHGLTGAGFPPDSIDTQASVEFTPGTGITGITLVCEASVPRIDLDAFTDIADKTKDGCPVSQALKAVPISLEATLR
ncbi:OsmC family peroxiredoxin [Salininema proteolyticum]|uniref:OsmC family peroxiredoxin n=1 Tax=Salininema proteolyticum TaxID=1607685 RepID=A0ABV8U2C3_9ACTN